MRHDLVEVLRNPLRFMREKATPPAGADPRAIPNKTIWLREVRSGPRLQPAVRHVPPERVARRTAAGAACSAVPASRFLRMKRSVSLLVSDREVSEGVGRPIQGTYQSPILVQWAKASAKQREVEVVLTRFK